LPANPLRDGRDNHLFGFAERGPLGSYKPEPLVTCSAKRIA